MSDATPVAITGMGCRLPGAHGTEAFWRMLMSGTDGIREVHEERHGLTPLGTPDALTGRHVPNRAGFLEEVAGFDADFFGIGPREAAKTDPQQRLLLETAWEALEDAGLPPPGLAGSRTAVYATQCHAHYGQLLSRDRSADPYSFLGACVPGMLGGRLAYALDLRGPAVTLESGCSSGLLAVQLAMRSLRTGESDIAVAGGVQLLLEANDHVAYTRMGSVSPQGASRFCDAEADGFARGEGCAALVLKTLPRARQDNDRIYAVLHSVAANNDGRAGGSQLVPSAESQQRVILDACRQAGITPAAYDFIETHGVGTPVGDPIEVNALGEVLATASRQRPCLVGSVKGNIGHSEPAAALTSLIKAALALQRRTLPPTLHHRRPTASVAWHDVPLTMSTRPEPLPRSGPITAGVSAFSVTGTNAHGVLTSPPDVQEADTGSSGPFLLALSARNPESLPELAAAYADMLEERADVPLADVCYTAAVRRPHHRYRTAVCCTDRASTITALRAADRVPEEPVRPVHPIAFVLTAQALNTTACTQLASTFPAFATALHTCETLIRETGNEALPRGRGEERPGREEAANAAARWAQQTALAELWRSWGVEPSAILCTPSEEKTAVSISHRLAYADALEMLRSGERPASLPAAAGPLCPVHTLPSHGIGAEAQTLPEPLQQHLLVRLDADSTLPCNAEERMPAPAKEGESPLPGLLTALGALYEAGCDIRWREVQAEARVVSLPLYPWRHRRYWAPTTGGPPQRPHPMLGERAVERRSVEWHGTLTHDELPLIPGIPPQGPMTAPGALLEALATGAARAAAGEPVALTELALTPAVADGAPKALRVRAEVERPGRWRLDLATAPAEHGPWTPHLSGWAALRRAKSSGAHQPQTPAGSWEGLDTDLILSTAVQTPHQSHARPLAARLLWAKADPAQRQACLCIDTSTPSGQEPDGEREVDPDLLNLLLLTAPAALTGLRGGPSDSISLDRMVIHPQPTRTPTAYCFLATGQAQDGQQPTADVRVENDVGEAQLELTGLAFQPHQSSGGTDKEWP